MTGNVHLRRPPRPQRVAITIPTPNVPHVDRSVIGHQSSVAPIWTSSSPVASVYRISP